MSPAPPPAAEVLLSGALALWAGLTVGWVFWGLELLQGDTHA
jgi:hypothetical protein